MDEFVSQDKGKLAPFRLSSSFASFGRYSPRRRIIEQLSASRRMEKYCFAEGLVRAVLKETPTKFNMNY